MLVSWANQLSAGVPGLEPRLAEPESAGLPITPYPMGSTAFAASKSLQGESRVETNQRLDFAQELDRLEQRR